MLKTGHIIYTPSFGSAHEPHIDMPLIEPQLRAWSKEELRFEGQAMASSAHRFRNMRKRGADIYVVICDISIQHGVMRYTRRIDMQSIKMKLRAEYIWWDIFRDVWEWPRPWTMHPPQPIGVLDHEYQLETGRPDERVRMLTAST